MVLRLLAAPTPTATAVPLVLETVRLSPVAWVLSCRPSLASMEREPTFKALSGLARLRLAIFAVTASSMVFVLTASPKAPPAAMA